MIDVIFDQAQVFIILLSFLLESSNITISGGNIRDLVLLIIAVKTKILLGLTRSLPGLASISTITSVSGWKTVDFLSFRIFVLVLIATR